MTLSKTAFGDKTAEELLQHDGPPSDVLLHVCEYHYICCESRVRYMTEFRKFASRAPVALFA